VQIRRTNWILHAAASTFTALRNAHHSSSACSAEPYVLYEDSNGRKPSRDSRSRDARGSGIRITGKLPANFDYSLEGVLERAPSPNDSIRASAGYVKAGYTLHSLPWRPHLQAEYDYASAIPPGSICREDFRSFLPEQPRRFGLTMFSVGRISFQRRLHIDLRRAKSCMFYAWRNSGCREYQRTPFIRALAVYSCIHRRRIPK